MSDDKNPDIRKYGFHAVEEDFGIEILKDGTWLHQGRPIKRLPLVKLFATVLKIDEKVCQIRCFIQFVKWSKIR